jgi:hypothetical protein
VVGGAVAQHGGGGGDEACKVEVEVEVDPDDPDDPGDPDDPDPDE